jgi:lysophospholipase L1-like esterase
MFAKTLALISSMTFVVSAAQAANQPKVVFFGDDLLYQWQDSGLFNAANSNWIGAGFSTAGNYGFIGSNYMASQFQTAVVAKHPDIVLLMAGASDMSVLVPNEGVLLQGFATNMTNMVNAARRANIKVILSTVPSMPVNSEDQPGTVLMFNAWIEQFGAANKIPVVNLHDLLCGCVDTTVPLWLADVYLSQYSASGPGPSGDPGFMQTLNDEGYEVLNNAVQTAITSTYLTLRNGYLSNVAIRPDGNQNPTPQQNNVPTGTTIQFTPQAVYSDGIARPVTNTDLNGATGIWTSSNPSVMSIDPDGLAFALSAGSSRITFKTDAGATFSPWDMTVTAW